MHHFAEGAKGVRGFLTLNKLQMKPFLLPYSCGLACASVCIRDISNSGVYIPKIDPLVNLTSFFLLNC